MYSLKSLPLTQLNLRFKLSLNSCVLPHLEIFLKAGTAKLSIHIPTVKYRMSFVQLKFWTTLGIMCSLDLVFDQALC